MSTGSDRARPAPPRDPVADWLQRRQVPGFRSGSLWKQAVAIVGYVAIVGALVLGIGGLDLPLLVLGLEGLVLALLIGNVAGVRGRIPILGSDNPRVARFGWLILAILFFLLFIGILAAVPSPAQ